MVEEATIKRDNSITADFLEVFKYDQRNNLIENASYYKKNLNSKRIELYDNRNKKIKTILVRPKISPHLPEYNKQKVMYDTTYQVSKMDTQGNVLKVISTDKKGNLESSHFKMYHKGKRVASYSTDAAGQLVFKDEVTKEGKLEKTTAYYPGEINGIEITWSENGKVVRSLSRSTNPESKSRSEYRYNEKGDEIVYTSYN